MQLAIDEVNEFGGINGHKLELIVEDSRTDPEEGENNILYPLFPAKIAEGRIIYF
jgi:ABC-type branched-subunit amino acid transport system substrate-binding protein